MTCPNANFPTLGNFAVDGTSAGGQGFAKEEAPARAEVHPQDSDKSSSRHVSEEQLLWIRGMLAATSSMSGARVLMRECRRDNDVLPARKTNQPCTNPT
ncbi:hypothetical protein AB0L71_08180 [Streptomyces sp. NPDC052052]|uniref:hypothetical protein n=1 Tax=Streptomyces sp. NPDC052052 TaxID=3154756 RepID=UPI00343BF919